jgi:hypothetical protein
MKAIQDDSYSATECLNESLDKPDVNGNFNFLYGFTGGTPSDYEKDIEILKSQVQKLVEFFNRDGRVIEIREKIVTTKTFPRYLNQKEVVTYIGHEKVFRILVDEYGLKPIRQEHKCSIYCAKEVEEKCIMFERNLQP